MRRNNVENAGAVTGAIVVWAFVILTLVGWVMNIFDLVGTQLDVITIELVLRIVGIFVVPLGAIMGLFF